jgi:AraC family transcriptional regulator
MSTETQIEFAELDVAPALAVLATGKCLADPSSITDAITGAFGTLMGYIGRHHLTPIAPPRTIYTAYSPQNVEFTTAMPIWRPHPMPEPEPPVIIDTLRGGKAYRFAHHGPYKNLMQTYGKITVFLQERGLLHSEADWEKYMPMWEEYMNDPRTTAESELLTYIYLPVS